ncbi:MAG: polyprenyl synthetase family protein [Capnocytophaga sp.]|nr:polyprenyl synthetase family protein [Capnocytophaga sp.]
MPTIDRYRADFLEHMHAYISHREPVSLYGPMHYILNIGGKRIRPILTLMGADIFGKDYKNALHAALAVEVFHNFSLVHDDIMDKAPLRRGETTVHEKWNLNTAILSGDAMLILAYQFFESYKPEIFRELAQLFSKTALEVCEGQQYDIDFESQSLVSEADYLLMIRYKTAVLVGAALQMGAIVAETSAENKQLIYDFGVQLGLAFQLQDDYLDTFGDDTFGKKIGGDILENKKTLLVIKALENANEAQRTELTRWHQQTDAEPEAKIQAVTQLFVDTKADEFIRKEIEKYTWSALQNLDALDIAADKKEKLKEFAHDLMDRTV